MEYSLRAVLVGLLCVIFIAKFGNGVSVRWWCGTKYDKQFMIEVVNDKTGDEFSVIETVNKTQNSSNCRAEGVATPDSPLTLWIKEEHFEECFFDVQDNGMNITNQFRIHKNQQIITDTYKTFFLNCSYYWPRTQSAVFGITTYDSCPGAGLYYCAFTGLCMNANFRCAGSDGVSTGKRCLNANNEEKGCDANGDGTYNIQVYKRNNTDIIEWVEFRGFVYMLENLLASEKYTNDITVAEEFASARPEYINYGSSRCTYKHTGQFNTAFNEMGLYNGEDLGDCLDYFQGFLGMLNVSCSEEVTNIYAYRMSLKDGVASGLGEKCYALNFVTAGVDLLRGHVTLITLGAIILQFF